VPDNPFQVVKVVGVVLVIAILAPLVAAGTAAVSILYLPLPAPPLPTPRPGVESRITHVYDATGAEIGVLRKFDTNIPVQPADIPEVLRQAVVAAEDKRFYSHRGFDLPAAVRAAWADIRGGEVLQGGSTITQQYVKNAYTRGERTLGRKIREAVLASRLDRRVDKDEILYRYLSNIYLGGGAYGVGAAAQSYFRKRVGDLTLSESALLAGIIPAPSTFEPRGNPTAAETNRVRVLDAMLEMRTITAARHAEAVSQRLFVMGVDGDEPAGPATVVQPLELQSTNQPYFFDYVRRYLEARYGEDLAYRGGLRVETTLDPRLQKLAEETVAEALDGTSPPLEMSLVSVEPGTGYVRALVGGRDFSQSQVNLALGKCPEPDDGAARRDGPMCVAGGGSGRQPGSAFKPFTLARAFEEGIGPSRVYSGPSSYTVPGCRGEGCTVSNVESGSYGSITLRQGTHYSVNTVYAQLVLDVGVKDTAEMAHRLGVTMVSPDGMQPGGEPYGASLTLGAAESSPLDMAAAYAVFAARGNQFPATPVTKVLDANGRVLEDNTSRTPKRVLSQAVADNVTDVLKGVIGSGTGKGADIGRPDGTAGKTGSSEENADAWFVGYTPALSTAIWMGYSDSNTKSLRNIKGVGTVYGGTIPASTWKAFMGEALKGAAPADFPAPEPLAGDVSAGGRRAPLQLTRPEPAPIFVAVPTFDLPTTTTSLPGIRRPGSPTTTTPGGSTTTTTVRTRPLLP
jgi:penicillin-binding protein 1A